MQLSRLSSRASAVTMLAGEIQQAEIVLLNIGGRLLQTELSTLTAVPSSHLAQLARHCQNYPQQPIFLDRNPKARGVIYLLTASYTSRLGVGGFSAKVNSKLNINDASLSHCRVPFDFDDGRPFDDIFQVFEELLEQLRAAKFGEDAYISSKDVEGLRALEREAKHFALDGKVIPQVYR